MSNNINAAIVLNAKYVEMVTAAIKAGGDFSSKAAAAAVKAFNIAICDRRLYEIQDLESRVKTLPPATRQSLQRAVKNCYALAFGRETADRNGNTVFCVNDCDMQAGRLLEADQKLWESRKDCAKHLDSFKIKIERRKTAAEPDKEALLEAALKAYAAYKAAGGNPAVFLKQAEPALWEEASKGKSKGKGKAAKTEKAA